MSIDDPADLTPEERRAEVVAILARGYLRFRSSNFAVGGKDLSAVNREQSLEPGANPRLHGSQKERMQ
jgi:hypothetical protein